MLDPTWTPEKGYSHADGLLAILARHDDAKAEQQKREQEEIDAKGT